MSAIWASARSAPSTGPAPVRGAPGVLPRTPRGRFGAPVRPVRRFRVPIRTLWGQTARFGQSNHGPTRPRPRRAPPSAGRPRGASLVLRQVRLHRLRRWPGPCGPQSTDTATLHHPKTTPKPPGTTIFGRLYTNMKQSCNNHALIMHQSCSNHALSCNNHALIMH